MEEPGGADELDCTTELLLDSPASTLDDEPSAEDFPM
jgi:hypothetical protein